MISLSDGIKNLLALYQQKVSDDEKRHLQKRIKSLLVFYILLRRLHSACAQLLFLVGELKEDQQKLELLGPVLPFEHEPCSGNPFGRAFSSSASDVKLAYMRVKKKMEQDPLDVELLHLYVDSIETGIDEPLAWSGLCLMSPRLYYDKSWKSSIDYSEFSEKHEQMGKALGDFRRCIASSFGLSEVLSIQLSLRDVLEIG